MLRPDEFDRVRAQARKFPDPESWRVGDPESYALALRADLIGDPHVTPHMVDRSRLTEVSVRAAAAYYATHADWREKDPITYWRASELGLLEDRSVVGHMRTRGPALSFPEVRRRAHRHETLAAWAAADPKGHEKAARSGWLSAPELVGHFPDAVIRPPLIDLIRSAIRYVDLKGWEIGDPSLFAAAREAGWLTRPDLTGHMLVGMQNVPPLAGLIAEPGRVLLAPQEVSAADGDLFADLLRQNGVLTPLGGGFLLIVESLTSHPPADRERALVSELARLTRARIVPGAVFEAMRAGLPVPDGSWPDYETDGLSLDLRFDRKPLSFRPSRLAWRLFSTSSGVSAVLRGLCSLKRDQIDEHADRVVGRLSLSGRTELRRRLPALPPRLRERLEIALARTSRGGR